MRWLIFIFALLLVTECAALTIRDRITASAIRHNIDPSLAIAIATVESGLNNNVVGTHGEQGIFQLHPAFHVTHQSNLDQHIDTALTYLARIKAANYSRYGDSWFVGYNRGPYRQLKAPSSTTYYQRVIAIYLQEKSLTQRAPYVR